MAYSRGEQINPIIGLGACAACWAHPTEYLLWVHFLVNAWTLEVFGGHTLSMHTTYPLCGWIQFKLASKRCAMPVGG